MTAAEFREQLEKDPAYQARQQEAEERRQFRSEDYQRAAAPVLADLKGDGVRLQRIAELRQRRDDYAAAVPVLLRWLPMVKEASVKEDIIRTLSVPWAAPDAIRPLLEEFRKTATLEDRIGWAIGNALEVIADDSVFDEVVTIATDGSYGRSREMIVAALGNMKDPKAKEILIELLDDDEVAGYAIMGLGKLKAKDARGKIEPFLKYPQEWVRKEAKKALDKIDRS